MSIPLDRLYHYIESIAKNISDDILIYRFYPHGSKKIEDLNTLIPESDRTILTSIELICHDQEPLNYDFYKDVFLAARDFDTAGIIALGKDIEVFKTNIRRTPNNIHDKCLLLHSEKNSLDVVKYSQDQFIPIYYWNHAILALDWYRYAKHVKKIYNNNNSKKFLIYNRSWSGTREYRLKLADLLIQYNLTDHCQTSCGFTDAGTHYTQHVFANNAWRPQHCLEDHYIANGYSANSSADFDSGDYQSTDIEIIAETLFDDQRIHLTEKSLRPIALGQPFILLASPGSLEYLKSYGFKTFESVIDESYDQIQDPYLRLKAVIHIMQDITKLSNQQYTNLLHKLNEIALYNKHYFFSDQFFNVVNSELTKNLHNGINELLSTNTYTNFLTTRMTLNNNKDFVNWREKHIPKNKHLTMEMLHADVLKMQQHNQ
jgi:hypothetical protein